MAKTRDKAPPRAPKKPKTPGARAPKKASAKPRAAKKPAAKLAAKPLKKATKRARKGPAAPPTPPRAAIPDAPPTMPRAGGATPRRRTPRVSAESQAQPIGRGGSTHPEGAHVIPATIVRRAGSSAPAPVMELHWGDPIPDETRVEGLIQRWVRRGDTLLRRLAEHGAAEHEYRADLRDGRFVWISPDGKVSAEAKAQVLCSWSKATGVLVMGWADPLVRGAAVPRIDGMPGESDDVDAETSWRVAMEAAEIAGAEHLYRVPTPHAWYFLALGKPVFPDGDASFTPATPVGFVMKGLGETRSAIESRAEPAEVLRTRIEAVGGALLHEAAYTYRDTDWVARLERTGKHLLNLAARVPRPSYRTIASGRVVDEWLDRETVLDLAQAIGLLEDEWGAF